jgi:transposase
MSELKCKKCGGTHYVKAGRIRDHQRYKCKDCGCQFTETPRRGVHPVLRSFALVLYAVCAVSQEKIGKLFGVSGVAVLKWIKAATDEVSEPVPHAESGIVMLDEMWHYVDGKKTKFGSGAPLMAYRVALSDGNWVIVAIPTANN